MVILWGETHWCSIGDVLRLRPASHARVLAWDLAVVLEGLAIVSCKPIESVAEKFLTLKTTFLLATTYLKRQVDLHALSVYSSMFRLYSN